MPSKEGSIIDHAAVAKLLPKKDSIVGKVKVKKPPPKPKESEGPPSPQSPLLNNLDIALRATFDSGRPMSDPADLIQCKHCKKPMLQSVAHSHIKLCLQKKIERAQKKKEQKEANRRAREQREREEKAAKDAAEAAVPGAAADSGDEEDSVFGDVKGGSSATVGKKSAVKEATSTSKKRKADGSDAVGSEKGPVKKKTKKEIEAAKPKAAVKPKGPVDVEKQCGVLLPNGALCARSLTCKSHAMGAKRAVPGRSLPYDMLLAAYQKKNQAKQQKAAIDAASKAVEDPADASGPVDSDEEKDQVMAAIARSRPKPLDQHIMIPLRRKYNYLRVKEMLSTALGGASRFGSDRAERGSVNGDNDGGGGVGGGGSVTGGQSRRGSLISQPPGSARSVGPVGGGLPSAGAGGGGGPGRKASVASSVGGVGAAGGGGGSAATAVAAT